MTGKGTIFGAFALLALLAALCLVVVLKVDIAPPVEKAKAPERTRNFGEGIRFSQKGLLGIDLVSIGRARMRKLRKGPFTIGALNELVLEDVELALPESLWGGEKAKGKGEGVKAKGKGEGEGEKAKGKGEGEGNGLERGSPRRMLAALGIESGHIKMDGKIPRFSALTIKKLKVLRIENGSNAVPWFAALSAKAERAGLALYSGWSVEDGVSNNWKEALLTIEPSLVLHHR